ncbi:hypothetical protein AAY473_011428 [Plecturocebus cupreus]
MRSSLDDCCSSSFSRKCSCTHCSSNSCSLFSSSSLRNSSDVITNHLSNHHHIWPQILVDTKDVQDSDVPEDDIHTVDDPAVAHIGRDGVSPYWLGQFRIADLK